MIYIKIIGFLAATLTTVSFIPQALKTWKTKSTKDLSAVMFSLLVIGVFLWMLYGLFIHDLPIILANLVTLCFAGIILYYIVRPQHHACIHHLAIWVKDIELIKNFYCENFIAQAGIKYYNSDKKFTSYFLSFSSGSKIEIMCQSDKALDTPSINHFALSLGSRILVDTVTRQLKEKGTEIVSEPRLTGDGYYESIIKDPEGNLIELTI